VKPNGILIALAATLLLSALCQGCKSVAPSTAPESLNVTRTQVGAFTIESYPTGVYLARHPRTIDVDIIVRTPTRSDLSLSSSRIRVSLVLRNGSVLNRPVSLMPPANLLGKSAAISNDQWFWYTAKFGSRVKPRRVKAVVVSIDDVPHSLMVSTIE
jgi:hypothetical protein